MKRHQVAALFVLSTLALILSSVAAAQVAAQPVKVGQSVMSAQMVRKVAPEYPAAAKQAGIQGTVVLKAVIDKAGDVQNLQSISGDPMLAPAAVEAVKQWKYKPYELNGEPVAVETNVTVIFTLADHPPEEGIVGSAPAGSPSGEAGVPLRVRVSQGVAQTLIASKVQPQYPGDAKAQHIQGEVQLKAIIDKEGNVENLQLVSGHPVLAAAAIDAVKQWKYRPYLLNGTPLEVETTVTVNFTLAN